MLPSVVAAIAAFSFQSVAVGEAEAKTPGKTYCFYKTCHRVKTIAETEALVGKEETIVASHYDSCKKDRYNPCGLTSSGEVFDPEDDDNAASPIYPDGTTLLVWSPETSAAVVLRVNNAGPYWGNRKLDLAKGAAKRLGFANKGVAKVKVRVLDAPTVAEASYKRNRTYDPLPGYIGSFASTDHAQAALASVAGLESLAKAVGAQETSETVALASAELPEASQTVAAEASRDGEGGEAKVQPTVRDRGVPLETAAQAEQPKPATLQATSDVGSKKRVQAKSRKSVAGKTPTRAARVAMAKSRLGKRNRVAASSRRTKAGAPARAQSRFLRADGTNDMSVFSRHVRPG